MTRTHGRNDTVVLTMSVMSQHAPYPHELAEFVTQLSYREPEGWKIWLEDLLERDPGSKGLTLVVQRCGPDSYKPDRILRVNHYFPVPPATYDRRSWQWWLFEMIGKVELHERMENFIIVHKVPGGYVTATGEHVDERRERPYAPAHGPGNDPYLVLDYGTEIDRRTSFRGELNPDG